MLVRMGLCDHLRESGFHVLEAANGSEARKIMTVIEHVDLGSSDVHMAHTDEGLELAAWLGEHYPGVPVILTSGSRAVAEAGAWKRRANITDFVPKPYSMFDLERLARSRVVTGQSDRP